MRFELALLIPIVLLMAPSAQTPPVYEHPREGIRFYASDPVKTPLLTIASVPKVELWSDGRVTYDGPLPEAAKHFWAEVSKLIGLEYRASNKREIAMREELRKAVVYMQGLRDLAGQAASSAYTLSSEQSDTARRFDEKIIADIASIKALLAKKN